MCGRYVSPDQAAIEREWHIGRHNWDGWVLPRFNVAPTSLVPIILSGEAGDYELLGARGDLIPSWWKKDKPPALTFNARSEEAAMKPTWRQSVQSKRCLMPARGWYGSNEREQVESASGRKVNRPYYICSPSSEVIAFAGLWSVWERPDAPSMLTCALMSKAAAPSITAIHHRMPVVLAPAQYDAWLDPATSANEVAALIAREDFDGHAVSTRVNKPSEDDAGLIESA